MSKLTQQRLKELFHYDPDTGIFTRKKEFVRGRKRKKQSELKTYLSINIDGKSYRAHRLAWLYVYGYVPEFEIIIKDGIKSNLRIKNIKEASHACRSQNQKLNSSNTSGFMGVSWYKNKKKWAAVIKIKGEKIWLGLHEDVISAALARVAFEDGSPDWTCNYKQVNRVKLRSMGYKV